MRSYLLRSEGLWEPEAVGQFSHACWVIGPRVLCLGALPSLTEPRMDFIPVSQMQNVDPQFQNTVLGRTAPLPVPAYSVSRNRQARRYLCLAFQRQTSQSSILSSDYVSMVKEDYRAFLKKFTAETPMRIFTNEL